MLDIEKRRDHLQVVNATPGRTAYETRSTKVDQVRPRKSIRININNRIRINVLILVLIFVVVLMCNIIT